MGGLDEQTPLVIKRRHPQAAIGRKGGTGAQLRAWGTLLGRLGRSRLRGCTMACMLRHGDMQTQRQGRHAQGARAAQASACERDCGVLHESPIHMANPGKRATTRHYRRMMADCPYCMA